MALRRLGMPPSLLSRQISCPIPRKHHPTPCVVMLADDKDSQSDRKITSLQIRSTFNTQLFENNPQGIVCYRNENGEMICEGYDEGPRFQTTTTLPSTFHPRDAKIIDLLQKNWVLLGDGRCSPYKSMEGSLLLQQEEY